ncbi:hypothetical protein Drorol1_Dr00003223 [Drosera rotundifolia]
MGLEFEAVRFEGKLCQGSNCKISVTALGFGLKSFDVVVDGVGQSSVQAHEKLSQNSIEACRSKECPVRGFSWVAGCL